MKCEMVVAMVSASIDALKFMVMGYGLRGRVFKLVPVNKNRFIDTPIKPGSYNASGKAL